jgi:hypothetical protein
VREHPQARVTVGDLTAEVDAEIAPLIEALWKLELITLNSCHDQDGRVWIHFATAWHAERFLDAVAGEPDDEVEGLHNRIVGKLGPSDPDELDVFDAERLWHYEALPSEYQGQIYLTISVRFPKQDYPAVLEVMLASPLPEHEGSAADQSHEQLR